MHLFYPGYFRKSRVYLLKTSEQWQTAGQVNIVLAARFINLNMPLFFCVRIKYLKH